MLRLVNKIPDNTKNVLIHLRYFFINIIIPPNFYKNLIIVELIKYSYYSLYAQNNENKELKLLKFISQETKKYLNN